MKNKIEVVVRESIDELNLSLEHPIQFSGDDARLYGKDGSLDSLSLVSLIVLIEEKLSEKECIDLILANEKAFSQKNSPFQSYKSLVSYVSELAFAEAGHG